LVVAQCRIGELSISHAITRGHPEKRPILKRAWTPLIRIYAWPGRPRHTNGVDGGGTPSPVKPVGFYKRFVRQLKTKLEFCGELLTI